MSSILQRLNQFVVESGVNEQIESINKNFIYARAGLGNEVLVAVPEVVGQDNSMSGVTIAPHSSITFDLKPPAQFVLKEVKLAGQRVLSRLSFSYPFVSEASADLVSFRSAFFPIISYEASRLANEILIAKPYEPCFGPVYLTLRRPEGGDKFFTEMTDMCGFELRFYSHLALPTNEIEALIDQHKTGIRLR